jgi:hypothetical protein
MAELNIPPDNDCTGLGSGDVCSCFTLFSFFLTMDFVSLFHTTSENDSQIRRPKHCTAVDDPSPPPLGFLLTLLFRLAMLSNCTNAQ